MSLQETNCAWQATLRVLCLGSYTEVILEIKINKTQKKDWNINSMNPAFTILIAISTVTLALIVGFSQAVTPY